MKAAPAKEKSVHGNVTHGDTLLKKAISKLGAKALDGRTTLALEIKQEERDLYAALGGVSEVSPQEAAIVRMIAMKRIRRKPIAEWCLLNRDKLFDRRKRALAPIALQLEQLEESEVRLLKELGLKRRAKQVPDLASYLAAKEAAPQSGEHH